MLSKPSVATIASSFRIVTIIPFTRPSAIPTSMDPVITTIRGIPAFARRPVAVQQAARIAPTDTSMSPTRRTHNIPSAAIAVVETFNKISIALSTLKNDGAFTSIIARIIT